MAKITKKFHEEMELSKLKPYKRNNKVHSEDQIAEIAKSIEENGFIDPIVVDEKFVILAGHGRKLGAEKAGKTTGPVLQVSGLTEKQKKTFRIKANRIADLSGYDLENLKVELIELGDDDLKELFEDIVDFDLDEDSLKNEEGANEIDGSAESTGALSSPQAKKDYDFVGKSLQEIKLLFPPDKYTSFLERIDFLIECGYEENMAAVVEKAVFDAQPQD